MCCALMCAIKFNIYIVIKSNIKLRIANIFRIIKKKGRNLWSIHNIRLSNLI